MKKPVMLMILDGFGLRAETAGNAIAAARTPNFDRLWAEWPHATLGASGLDVGLPDGQMGNSEVGHTNIGAGRIVYQELTRITKAIQDGDFFSNPALNAAIDALDPDGTLHLMGLLSDGGVHSHNTHLYALLELAHRRGVRRVAVHSFLDGRDTDPKSGAGYLEELETEMKRLGTGFSATVTGRYYAMDRDKRWERVREGYEAVALGRGTSFTDAAAAVRESYAADVTDEFVKPLVREGYGGVRDGDSIIFYNFRPDRAREMTRAFVAPEFDGFPIVRPRLAAYVCMTCYDATMPNCSVAFCPQELTHTLGEVVEENGLSQLRIAETEKYAHVTFFFNGGVEAPSPHEDRILIASPKVATYDLKPEMSAYEVTDALLEALEKKDYGMIVLNYANCDMVGHTGVFEAAVRAVEAVDECLGRVVGRVLALGGVVLLTADHGNADMMQNPDGSPMTAHTTNRVPVLSIGERRKLREGGALCDLAPTVLELLGIDPPAEMSGKSLFC
ncbi:MAG: 2,3-bisphosphoglycerate-independent phosphoglycerate mutase [Oscillospiraceae bacterium]|nr:2,3-bisphosphoglycerate-independent phosphoglycerate mutase [Oscillospiraceae bacterium]